MRALLRKPRVVDDPGRDRSVALDDGQHEIAHASQYRFIRPGGLANEMQERLMFCGDARRGHQGGHRFDALALTRHQQTEAVISQGLLPIGMTDHLGQSLAIGPKPLLAALRLVIHASHHPLLLESPDYQKLSRSESPLQLRDSVDLGTKR